MSGVSPIASSTQPVLDERLHCPHCDYQLAGLTVQRCPECGRDFDLNQLQRFLASEAGPVPGWDDGASLSFADFLGTCVMTWFHPIRFGKKFPPAYRRRTAMVFRALALFVALVIYTGLQVSSIRHQPLPWDFFLITIVDVIAGVFTCEGLTWLLFALTLRPRAHHCEVTNRDWSRAWRGVIGYYRSFLLISALALGFSVLWLKSPEVCWSVVVAVIAWWWICLGATLCAMAQATAGRVVAILLIPVIAYLSIVAGVFASIPLLWLFPHTVDFIIR